MSTYPDQRSHRRQRLLAEVGRISCQRPNRVGLVYPSPYSVGMSSLGYQTVYRLVAESERWSAERYFAPDPDEGAVAVQSYDSERTLGDCPLLALSVAYELELEGVIKLLLGAGIPPQRTERDASHPLIVAGGPLTFSNPSPLLPFVDAVVLGEAEEVFPWVLSSAEQPWSRARLLEELATHPSIVVPSLTPHTAPVIARAPMDCLPATSVIRTPHTELSDMFLIEAERGCSRSCGYCVMRRSNSGGMRIVPKDRILSRIAEDVSRVGLVGAGVSDHPDIAAIVGVLAERHVEVGLSSLRPDRISDALVEALILGGCRTLTTALDGPSERMRNLVGRRCDTRYFRQAAEACQRHRMKRLKLYLMVGLPTETDEDIDECATLLRELSGITPVSVGISPFCAKDNTPLAREPYAGISTIDARLARLRRHLSGRVELRATSARWGWVEHVLARGGPEEGLAVLEAVRDGGGFAAYRRVFEGLGHRVDGGADRAKTLG